MSARRNKKHQQAIRWEEPLIKAIKDDPEFPAGLDFSKRVKMKLAKLYGLEHVVNPFAHPKKS